MSKIDKERMIAHQAKRKKAIKRLEAFKTHLEHIEDGRSRIAKIIGCGLRSMNCSN